MRPLPSTIAIMCWMILFFIVPQHLGAQSFLEMAARGENFFKIQKQWLVQHPEKKDEFSPTLRVNRSALQKPTVANQVESDIEEEEEGMELLYHRWEEFWKPRVLPNGDFPKADYLWQEWRKLQEYEKTQSKKSRNQTMAAASWRLLGPTTKIPSGGGGAGRVNCIRFNPDEQEIVWAGSPAGGLWKSTDLGVHWTTTTDSFPSLGISDIAINPKNVREMYVSTGDMDGGHTFSFGVLKSTDEGRTWKRTGLTFDVTSTRQTGRLVINPSDPNILFCATSNGLYGTTDGGSRWNVVQVGSFQDVEFMPSNPLVVFACAGGSIYRSANGGSSFSRVSNGLGSLSANRIALGVTPANPNYVYALASNFSNGFGGLYRSTDGGLAWQQMSSGTSINILNWYNDGTYVGTDEKQGQGYYDLAIAVSLNDPEKIYCGGVNIWTSTNGGSNWKISSHWEGKGAPYVHADIHALELVPDPSIDLLLAGTDGGVFLSDDGGEAWADRSNSLQILQYYRIGTNPANPAIVIGGCQDNGTNLYTNGDWKRVYGADGMEAFFEDGGIYAYCTIYYGKIYRSQNGGVSFKTEITPLGSRTGGWITPYVLNPLRQSTLYCGANAGIYRSDERGDYWYPISKSQQGGANFISISAADTARIYASTSSRVWMSSNSGALWNDVGSTLSAGYFSAVVADPSRAGVVALCYSGYSASEKVFLSSNGGSSWKNISKKGLPNVPVNCAAFYKTNCISMLFVGTDLGVFFTTEDSDSWQRFNNGLPNVIVRDLELHGNILHAGTFGRGLWEIVIPVSTPKPEFKANVTTVCAGVPVKFSNISSGANGVLQWTFDGAEPSFSDASDPTVSYAKAGVFDVKLRVKNSCNSDSAVSFKYITVIDPTPLPSIERNINTLFMNASGTKQWYINGTVIAGATSDNYTVSKTGVYTVQVVDNQGCTSVSAPFDLTALGIETIVEIDDVELFPNPVSEELTLRYHSSRDMTVHLEVSELRSSRLRTADNKCPAGVWTYNLSVREFPPGEYFIDIRINDRRFRKRFLKQ